MSPTEIGLSRLDPEKRKQEVETKPPALTPKPPLDIPLTSEQVEQLREKIVANLCTIFDPEIPVNIYELGLIYQLQISPAGEVSIGMTLTSPACPVAGTLPGDVQRKIHPMDLVSSVKVDLVRDPPWDKSRMTEAAKLQLGIDD